VRKQDSSNALSVSVCGDRSRPAGLIEQVLTLAASKLRILVVDDDLAAGKLLSILLVDAGFSCTAVDSGIRALRLIERESFDAVLSDMCMPSMSGVELLVEIRRKFPHIPFVVTTGVEDMSAAIEAMRSGADDYLVKPLLEEAVIGSLVRALRRRQFEQEIENYHLSLERKVADRTAQLNQALEHVRRSYEETLRALGAAIDLRDGATAGHSWRVCAYSLELGSRLQLPGQERGSLARAAYLHDIGKLAIPDSVLLKPGSLTEEEWVVMRQHVQMGFDLLKGIPFLADAAEIVLSHHERFDGTGYPRRLRDGQIPLGSRIFAVADAFDAITSDRPYRSAASVETARTIITKEAGSQFDPAVVDVFLKVPLERWREIAVDSRHFAALTSELLGVGSFPV
jgi:response regulator RpfG family c-di-GMP phosphodiesterase